MPHKENEPITKSELLTHTTQIVSAHLSHGDTASAEIPEFIKQVYKTLETLSAPNQTPAKLTPPYPIQDTVMPDYIICLEDGKKLKMLKRHLKSSYGMTPEDYREKWGLPLDYPMVAPNYAKKRSELAKEIGLGTHQNQDKKS